MYLNGMGLRAIERVTEIHYTKVTHSIREAAATLPKVENENGRLRHYLARLHRKTFCYSKSVVNKTYMTRVESETLVYVIILFGYIAKLCVIRLSPDMLKYSIRLLLHDLKYKHQTVPVPS